MHMKMAPLQGESKKHNGGFDLYGGVFNSRLFGSAKFDKSSRQKQGKGSSNIDLRSLNQDDRNHGVGEACREFVQNNKKSKDVSEAAAAAAAHGSSTQTQMQSQSSSSPSDLCWSDNSNSNSSSFRSSPSMDPLRLSRKSSDASTCSSCTSGSIKGGGGSSPINTPTVNPTPTPARQFSGELGCGSLTRGNSNANGSFTATDYSNANAAAARGRWPSFGRSRSTGSVMAATVTATGNSTIGNSARPKSGNNFVPPRASIAGAPGNAINGGYFLLRQSQQQQQQQEADTKKSSSSSSCNVILPMGNILPNGNGKLAAAAARVAKPEQTPHAHVLGSGSGHYGHGSIMRSGSGSGSGNGNVRAAAENIGMRRILLSSDAEEVKNAGNEQYKKGNFAEALLLYERAITLSPGHALYHSNKSAALTGLGRFADAITECEQAIKLDPACSRAHQRLASLFLRLGEIENAKKHCKLSGQTCDWNDIQKVHAVEQHVNRCREARMIRDWKTFLKESTAAITAGADAAPQFFACKAEALLNLRRFNDADAAIIGALKKIQLTTPTKYFGIAGSSYVYFVQAQVDMAMGRFESANANAERAARIDLYSHEVSALLRKTRGVAYARALGNDLFKVEKFFEACTAYGEGLEHDPLNAVLLCNRAACRSKIGQWEKAIEDCNLALNIRPNYTKALLRRADSNAKLERWEEALRDYEALRREMPGDVDVAKAFYSVQVELKKSLGEEIKNLNFGGEVQIISSSDQFRKAITAPGLAVVHFSTKTSDKCKHISPLVEQLCKRYPSVNFLKVDAEENLYLSKLEGVSAVPAFKIYKNGVKVKEIIGPSMQVLEYSIKHYSH